MKEERRTALVGAIKASQSRELLEDFFRFFEISDDAETKNSVLIEAMGNPKVGFCGEPTPEEKYETLVCVFLSNTWREAAAKG